MEMTNIIIAYIYIYIYIPHLIYFFSNRLDTHDCKEYHNSRGDHEVP